LYLPRIPEYPDSPVNSIKPDFLHGLYHWMVGLGINKSYSRFFEISGFFLRFFKVSHSEKTAAHYHDIPIISPESPDSHLMSAGYRDGGDRADIRRFLRTGCVFSRDLPSRGVAAFTVSRISKNTHFSGFDIIISVVSVCVISSLMPVIRNPL
jgi:hypothetical protein